MTNPTVFISSSLEGLPVARELGRQLESSATITLWAEGGFLLGKSTLESLAEIADRSDFAIIYLTADDTLGGRSSPRHNVIFELGYLVGRLGSSRTFVVYDPAQARLPSDLAGTAYIPVSTNNPTTLTTAIAPAAAIIRGRMEAVGTRPNRLSSKFHSCFISYSWQDQEFAARLYDDLQSVGIRAWLDAKEIQTGVSLSGAIDKAIQAHDKVLPVLSSASLQSSWVRLEIRNALRLEVVRQQTVLFPIRLDDAIFDAPSNQEIDQLKERVIGDFRNWRDKALYQRAFSRLVRDLTISASVESGRRS